MIPDVLYAYVKRKSGLFEYLVRRVEDDDRIEFRGAYIRLDLHDQKIRELEQRISDMNTALGMPTGGSK